MTARIYAPFTPEQVEALNAYQHAGRMHPFTCAHEHPDERPVLVATIDGWQCPDTACDYRQFWAHDFMTTPEWNEPGFPGLSAVPPLPVTNRGGWQGAKPTQVIIDEVGADLAPILADANRRGDPYTGDPYDDRDQLRDPGDGPVVVAFQSNPEARLQPTGPTAHGILRALTYAAFDQQPPAIDAPAADDIRQQHIGHLLTCVLAGIEMLGEKVDADKVIDQAVAALLWIGVTDTELQVALVYARARLQQIG